MRENENMPPSLQAAKADFIDGAHKSYSCKILTGTHQQNVKIQCAGTNDGHFSNIR